MYKQLLAAAMTFGLALPAQAMPGASGTDRFAAMDANADGHVVWAEFEAAMPQMRREAFDAIDLNKDANITREEWDSFRKNHGMQPGGQPGAMQKGANQAPASPAAPAGKPLIQPPTN